MSLLPLTVFDYVVIGVLLLSLLVGLVRGLVREVFGLGSWIIALVLARLFAASLASMFPDSWGSESVRYVEAFAVILLTVKIVLYAVSVLLRELISAVGLASFDRLLGALFGLIRGALLVLVAVLACGLTLIPQQPYWKEALLAPIVVAAAQQVLPYLPEYVAEKVVF